MVYLYIYCAQELVLTLEIELLELIRSCNVRSALIPIALAVVKGRREDHGQEEVQRPNSQGQERLLDLTEEENCDAIYDLVNSDLTDDGGEKAPIEAHCQHREGPGGSSSELQAIQVLEKMIGRWGRVADARNTHLCHAG